MLRGGNVQTNVSTRACAGLGEGDPQWSCGRHSGAPTLEFGGCSPSTNHSLHGYQCGIRAWSLHRSKSSMGLVPSSGHRACSDCFHAAIPTAKNGGVLRSQRVDCVWRAAVRRGFLSPLRNLLRLFSVGDRHIHRDQELRSRPRLRPTGVDLCRT